MTSLCLLAFHLETIPRSSSNLAKESSSNSPEPRWHWQQQEGRDREEEGWGYYVPLPKGNKQGSLSPSDFPLHSLVFPQDFQICLCSLGAPTLHSSTPMTPSPLPCPSMGFLLFKVLNAPIVLGPVVARGASPALLTIGPSLVSEHCICYP